LFTTPFEREIAPLDFYPKQQKYCSDIRVTPIGRAVLLDQNWITFLVNSLHGWRGGKLDRSDEERETKTMARNREKNDTGNPAEMNWDYFYDVSQSSQ